MKIFTSWGWLVGDGEEKCKVWGAGSVCARAGAFGGGSMSDYHESVSENLEICGCGPSSMFTLPAMWRAGQLCKGSVLGCSLNLQVSVSTGSCLGSTRSGSTCEL